MSKYRMPNWAGLGRGRGFYRFDGPVFNGDFGAFGTITARPVDRAISSPAPYHLLVPAHPYFSNFQVATYSTSEKSRA
jgi:hypothetical protein